MSKILPTLPGAYPNILVTSACNTQIVEDLSMVG
jgi:hypothetical protein